MCVLFPGERACSFHRISKMHERQVWSRAAPSYLDSPWSSSHPSPPLPQLPTRALSPMQCPGRRPDPPIPCLQPTEMASYHTCDRTHIPHGAYKAQRDGTRPPPPPHAGHVGHLPVPPVTQPRCWPVHLLLPASPSLHLPSGLAPLLPDLGLNVTPSPCEALSCPPCLKQPLPRHCPTIRLDCSTEHPLVSEVFLCISLSACGRPVSSMRM